MFGPIVSSFQGMENGRFDYMFEALQIGWRANRITDDFAVTALRFLADYKLYDGMISREVNFRPTDLSTVLTAASRKKYLSRLFQQDGEDVVQRIKFENPSLLFLTHQLLGNMEIALDAFGERLKIIEPVRHPYYLIHHWESNFDFCSSGRDFNLSISDGRDEFPWFAVDWIHEFREYTRIEGAIVSITKLMNDVLDIAENNNHRLHTQTLFISFEHFVINPYLYISKLEKFLDRKAPTGIEEILGDQKVPRLHINGGPTKNIYLKYGTGNLNTIQEHKFDYLNLQNFARENVRNEVFLELEAVSRRYETMFGFWF